MEEAGEKTILTQRVATQVISEFLRDTVGLHQLATTKNDLKLLERVEKNYLKLLEKTPHHAELLQLLGTVYIQINKNPLAIQVLERCVSINPDIGEAWNNLGNAYRIDHHWDDAERAYKEAVRCHPENGENYNNWGTNYVNEGHPAKGEEILRSAVKYAPDNPHGWWNLSLTLLEQGKYEEGFEYYRYGMDAGIRFERFYGCNNWDGGPTDHLVLYGEQGIGDEIMYASLIPRIKNVKRITFDCHPRLIEIFRRAFPWVQFHPTRKISVIDWAREETFTARCAMGDLPKYFIKTWRDFERVPYLVPPEDKSISLPSGLNYGISWEGGRKKTRNDYRSLALEDMLPIIKARPDVNWISLQYTPESRERVQKFNKDHGTNIKHMPQVHEDNYDWTLAVVSKLDLVITVNTSLVHLCGATGINTKVLTPFGKAWRYYSPDGHKMAWYGDHIEQYMQGEDRDWKPVIARVIHDITNH